jgi:hypothetical protein
MWEQRPKMEDALPAPPYSSAGAPAGDYLGPPVEMLSWLQCEQW